MNFSEYALAKKRGYENLGWKISHLVETDNEVSFYSVSTDNIIRKHFFSITDIKVEQVNELPAVELKPELLVEVNEQPKKKSRKSKKVGE